MLHALLIDDDEDFLAGLAEIARQEGFAVTHAGSLKEAREILARESIDIALVDLALPDGEGIELLRELKDIPGTDVIIISGVATVDSAIEALRLGALDYLTKPLDTRRLRAVLANAARVRSLKEQVGALRGELRKFGRFGRMIGGSPRDAEGLRPDRARSRPRTPPCSSPGRAAPGKELVAQAIVRAEPAPAPTPFIPLDCGAIAAEPDRERAVRPRARQLHRRDPAAPRAASSARRAARCSSTRSPRCRSSCRSSCCACSSRASLTRVGGETRIPVAVRLIAASNRAAAGGDRRTGKLREDLFYRLNVFPIVLPPLRERGEDVLLLADAFLEALNARRGDGQAAERRRARERIRAYPWPGNVRELKNELQRAFIMAEDVIELDGLAPGRAGPRRDLPEAREVGGSLDDAERQLILAHPRAVRRGQEAGRRDPRDQPQDPLQPAPPVRPDLIAAPGRRHDA